MTVAAATELWRLNATELAEAIRSGQASSQEVVEAQLRRIESVNPAINAVVLVLADQALAAAKSADGLVAAGAELPPLHGVPFTVKENIDVVGTPRPRASPLRLVTNSSRSSSMPGTSASTPPRPICIPTA